MLKPLGVNVPGSPTSTIPGSAPLRVETPLENPSAALAQAITEETLAQLPVKALRELVECIHTVSADKLSKSGKKMELIRRIMASPHKEVAVHRFLLDKDVSAQCKHERIRLKLFASLRGGLRQAGVEILRDLGLPYSHPGLPEDQLPVNAHQAGECPDPEDICLVCRVFGSLTHPSIFRNYIPPLVDDPDHKLEVPQEVNHVLIRIHARNVHRPDGSTLNFNQQYFAGVFFTYLSFPHGLPDPVALGFLLNCLERCDQVGGAKAWGAGKLFLQAYTLEKVECAFERTWEGDTFHIRPKLTVTPLKVELEQAFNAYSQWITQMLTPSEESDEENVIA